MGGQSAHGCFARSTWLLVASLLDTTAAISQNAVTHTSQSHMQPTSTAGSSLVGVHSCYYFIVHISHCAPAKDPAGNEKCLACAHEALPKEPNAGYERCTLPLVQDACHGILPHPEPPSPPKPSDLTLTLLPDAAAEKGAVCLDGSPAGYYFRPGTGEGRNKWLLIFNGGGWCVGKDGTATAAAKGCAERAEGSLGSSKPWAPRLAEDAHGMTNSNCTVNPAFCSWSMVYMYYCDGVSFSGDLETPVDVPGAKISPIYFRGKRIMDANIADLLAHRDLGAASRVVLSGHSAGGLATYLHADYVRKLLPKSLGSYGAVPDAGYFLDHPDITGLHSFGEGMRATFSLANASSVYNTQCLLSARTDTDCIFPQNFAKHIATPMHVTQSQYDAWQLPNILKLGCDPPQSGSKRCSADQLKAFQQYRLDMMTRLNASGLFRRREGYGIWNDACIAHTQGYYGNYMDNPAYAIPSGSGNTLAASLHAWVNSEDALPVHIDEVPWPDNQNCAKLGVQNEPNKLDVQHRTTLQTGPPIAYWMSNPTLANETLLIAGAGMAGATVELCSDQGCNTKLPLQSPASTWDQSVQLVLPNAVHPPTFVKVSSGGVAFTMPINAPEIWWAISGRPGISVNGSLQVNELHPSWVNATIHIGETVRVFGRSLAWDSAGVCISGRGSPAAVSTTRLDVPGGASVTASAANCFEATFPSNGLPIGTHLAKVSTEWGEASFGLTILPAPPVVSQKHIDVSAFGGDLMKALAQASSLPASEVKVISMGHAVYKLSNGLTLPPNTTLKGVGSKSILEFSITPPKPTAGNCSAPVAGLDFFKKLCDPNKEHCFHDVKEYDNTTSSLQDCCDKCVSDPLCNAWTHEYDHRRGFLCILKSCQTTSGWEYDCATSPGSANNSCAFVHRANTPGSMGTGAITVSSDAQLLNFSIKITAETTVPEFPAVVMPANAMRAVFSGLHIQMLQNNVSNAFKIFGKQFEIGGNVVHQAGLCLWPGYGPKSDATPFQPSVTLYMNEAVDGWVHDNEFYWKCSMMDLDVSDRVIFEDNLISMTEPGIPPHGNSISGYNYAAHPSSRFWSVSRNTLTRPPSSYADKQIWTQRETLTTDGSGWWASGHAESVTATGLVLDLNMTTEINAKGPILTNGVAMLTLKVLGGPGVGASRIITAWDNSSRTLQLETPLDPHFSPTDSIIAIVGSFGAKAFVGNTFVWTEVMQWYSNTLGGIMADNSLTDVNVLNGGNVGNASVGAYGACYNGPGPVWFTEFTGNTMVRSDGIALLDQQHFGSHGVNQNDCPAYEGAYIRWSVIRRNNLSGISRAQQPENRCASITNSNPNSTDVLSEHNVIDCPEGGVTVNANGAKLPWTDINCSHCVTRR